MIEKYGLEKKLAEVGADVRDEVSRALATAENRISVTTVTSHWREIVIVVFLVAVVFAWREYQDLKHQLADLRTSAATAETIKKIEEKTSEIADREQNLYPQLQAQLDSLKGSISSVDSQIKKIKFPKKEVIAGEVASMTVEQLSKELLGMGFSNEVKRGVK